MHFKGGNKAATIALAALLCLSTSLAAPAIAEAKQKQPKPHTVSATYYAPKYHGRKTANGERHDPKAFTAAHPTLPMGTLVEVKRVSNGKSVVVRINDRNAHHAGIDLSYAAARKLGLLGPGRADVQVIPLKQIAQAR